MLIEITCPQFKQKTIHFKPSLNTVLGGKSGENSIGKSSLLLIIDFAFGGSDFVTSDNNTVKFLGDLNFNFVFLFKGIRHYFQRSTATKDSVNRCNDHFECIQAISLNEYTDFLRSNYELENLPLSFRETVSLTARIWDKDNLNIKKPLHVVQQESSEKCLSRLIKLFNKYDALSSTINDLEELKAIKAARNVASKHNLIPKINKSKYLSNKKQIKETDDAIENIKKLIAINSCTNHFVISSELLDLKNKQDELSIRASKLKLKINRSKKNLQGIDKKNLSEINKIKEFFPNIDTKPLYDIENFHNKIGLILSKEISAYISNLENELHHITTSLIQVQSEISTSIGSGKNISPVVDKIATLATTLKVISDENLSYENKRATDNRYKEQNKNFIIQKASVLEEIQNEINATLIIITKDIYKTDKTSPQITFLKNNYSFTTPNDSGTGTSYSGLLTFDLSLFKLTQIPFLIHDSVLFKNIETDVVSNIISLYTKIQRQSFIAIDEINKYNAEAEKILRDAKSIHLTKEHPLFTMRWNTNSSSIS